MCRSHAASSSMPYETESVTLALDVSCVGRGFRLEQEETLFSNNKKATLIIL